MNRQRRNNRTKLYGLLALTGLVLLFLWPTFTAAMPLTAKHQLENAWRFASQVGSYRYQTTLIQNTHPTEKLVNVGRSTRPKRLTVQGMMDKTNETMYMKINPHRGKRSLEMKVEQGKSYGRLNASEEWTEVETQSDIFAPGGDPLGYLNAATNVRMGEYANSDDASASANNPLADLPIHPFAHSPIRIFAFDINGPAYAQYIQAETKAELRRRGELPAGMDIGLSEAYLTMTGHGEIWLDEDGFPVRQIIHIEFPATEKAALNYYSADITTDFSNWREATGVNEQIVFAIQRLWNNPESMLSDPYSLFPASYFPSPQTVQQFTFLFGLTILLLSLIILLIIHRNSQKLYAAISLSVIFSMLFTPLLQTNQIHAYTQQQRTKQREQNQTVEQRQTIEDHLAEVSGRNFNPHVKPVHRDTSFQRSALEHSPDAPRPVDAERLSMRSNAERWNEEEVRGFSCGSKFRPDTSACISFISV
ncbi:hypothetical protein QUF58_02410 [Anaerolineales bacterium HSG24]|nr:hypothetical protein [Anaerolineales bacterium HSG24]